MGRVAVLLLIAGLAALIVEHKLPAEAAYGMIGLGIVGIAAMAVLHRRHHHHEPEQAS
jgi:membrane-bound ClpP family serine protease